MRLHLVARIVALSGVDLIQGASQAVVLSDIATAAAERAGELSLAFVRRATDDRVPFRAMRPTLTLSNRKSFVAAQLFTIACGELLTAPLANG
jgi:hypothetical protein